MEEEFLCYHTQKLFFFLVFSKLFCNVCNVILWMAGIEMLAAKS